MCVAIHYIRAIIVRPNIFNSRPSVNVRTPQAEIMYWLEALINPSRVLLSLAQMKSVFLDTLSRLFSMEGYKSEDAALSS
jgi:hypothetical protein